MDFCFEDFKEELNKAAAQYVWGGSGPLQAVAIVRVLSSLSMCCRLGAHSRQYIFERTSKGARSLHFNGSQGCGKAQ